MNRPSTEQLARDNGVLIDSFGEEIGRTTRVCLELAQPIFTEKTYRFRLDYGKEG